jgi:dienelactone hydrolase
MKSTRILSLAMYFLFLSGITSCNKDESAEPALLSSIHTSEITETGFKIGWSVTSTDVQKITVELSRNEGFEEMEQVFEESGQSSGILIQGLQGATKYYYRIVAETADGPVFQSGTFRETTPYTSETITITTSDGISLSAKLCYLSYVESKKPAILFMHEMGAFVNNWKSSDCVTGLVAKEYVCLILDFRGHGNSTPIEDLSILIDDWSLVATDLVTAIEYLQGHDRVDGQNIALAGGSLGGIMALAGNGFEEVRCSISLSGARLGIYQLFPDLVMKNCLYIAGENDANENANVNFAEEAELMFNLADEPKKLIIKDGSPLHGTDLLIYPNITDEVINWIDGTFNQADTK